MMIEIGFNLAITIMVVAGIIGFVYYIRKLAEEDE